MNSSYCPQRQRMKDGIHQSLKSTQKSLLSISLQVIGVLNKNCRSREAEKEESQESKDETHVKQKQIAWTTNLKEKVFFKSMFPK